MPFIPASSYPGPPRFQFNGDLQTLWPGVFRKVKNVPFRRERLELSDGDFVDLDWLQNGGLNLVILTHGLEGNSSRHYIKGMAKHFAQKGWDALAWNCRSCSGEMNRKLRLYNHGEIADIGEVIDHALQKKDYQKIVLIGFSMGGNILLKYLGVNATTKPDRIKGAVAFSAPVDLHSSVAKLDQPAAAFYRKRFMKMLRPKIEHKARQFPGVIDVANFEKITCWKDFDDYFSAPLNGYKNANDFYDQASALNFVTNINVPVLLVNAQNDPILTPACFPQSLAQSHSFLHFEAPRLGGHVGFDLPRQQTAWSELRAWEFVEQVVL